jgi:hypothetical protein
VFRGVGIRPASGQRAARPHSGRHRSFNQLRPGVLMLNIPAAGLAPRRARRQAELPDRQQVDAEKLLSPNAALPQTPVSGRAKQADCGPVESGTYERGFRRFLKGGWSARQAVPTPMPSSREMTLHEAPEARRLATWRRLTATGGSLAPSAFSRINPDSIPQRTLDKCIGLLATVDIRISEYLATSGY